MKNGNGISLEEAREEIARLVEGGAIGENSRAHKLLDYLVAKIVAGEGEAIKAYAIAVDVLGRGQDFDPGKDSIVRVEIGRLRRQLEAWYAGPGAHDPIRITIPKGQTRPVLMRQAARFDRSALGARTRMVRLAALAVLVLTITLFIAGQIMPRFVKSPAPSSTAEAQKPLIEVAGFESENVAPDLSYLATGLHAQVIRRLAESGAVLVRDNHLGKDTSGLTPADYKLRGILRRMGDALMLDLLLSDTEDDIVVFAGQIVVDPDDPKLAPKLVTLLNAMLLHIVGRDVLLADETEKATEPGETDLAIASQFACHLRFHAWDESKDPALEAPVRACLTRWVEAGSDDGMIWAGYALMTMLDWVRDGADPEDHRIVQAEMAARRAVALAPGNVDAHQALASILIAMRDPTEARSELETAIALDPSRPDLYVLLGWLYAEEGDWTRGIAQVRKGLENAVIVPGWYRIPLALDALRRGDDAEALAQAEKMIAAHDTRGHLLALAAALRLGDAATARRAREALAAEGQSVDQALAGLTATFGNAEITALLHEILAPELTQ